MKFTNEFANGRFARTQPREWQHIPFREHDGHVTLWKGTGIAVLWVALLCLSLWSISAQVSR